MEGEGRVGVHKHTHTHIHTLKCTDTHTHIHTLKCTDTHTLYTHSLGRCLYNGRLSLPLQLLLLQQVF